MATTYAPTEKTTESRIEITRVFNAPREVVFRAWAEPERAMRWWGPKGFTTPYFKTDLRPGGTYHNCMRSPEGRDYWSKGVYCEVIAPERLVCSDYFSDEAGRRVSPTQYGMSADWPAEATVTITFVAQGGKTKVTLRHETGSAPAAEREMCRQGWSEMLDKLADYLATGKD